MGLILALVISYQLMEPLQTYVSNYLQEEYGDTPLAPGQEANIKHIAQEMGISQPFIIRKMSTKALLTWGYHNALALFPVLFNFLPISSTPFLFISEGFLEDLTPEEQRFLIGHELTHIKEQHVRYLNLVLYVVYILLLLTACFCMSRFKHVMSKYISFHINDNMMAIVLYGLLGVCFVLTNLGALAYRRHVEWVADHQSLTQLKSYDGCLKLLDRWEKEFYIPAHNPYGGILADHPSCRERKTYCLQLRNISGESL